MTGSSLTARRANIFMNELSRTTLHPKAYPLRLIRMEARSGISSRWPHFLAGQPFYNPSLAYKDQQGLRIFLSNQEFWKVASPEACLVGQARYSFNEAQYARFQNACYLAERGRAMRARTKHCWRLDDRIFRTKSFSYGMSLVLTITGYSVNYLWSTS